MILLFIYIFLLFTSFVLLSQLERFGEEMIPRVPTAIAPILRLAVAIITVYSVYTQSTLFVVVSAVLTAFAFYGLHFSQRTPR